MVEINWPENLIEEIAYNRCIIFTGAGISAQSVDDEGNRMKTWKSFVETAIEGIDTACSVQKDYAQQFYENGDLLQALQVVRDYMEPGSYKRLLQDNYNRRKMNVSEAHEILKDLNMKTIVTTNFDTIYDDYCRRDSATHVVTNFYETPNLMSNLKSVYNVIIKAHGTISDPDNLIFTQDEYFKAKRIYPSFYKILESLFLTHTVLFLGYSMADPDIQLLLNSAENTASSLTPHYILVKDGEANPETVKHWSKNYNISTVCYGPTHDDFLPNFKKLAESVQELRVDRGLPY
jgi:hypothetical protein